MTSTMTTLMPPPLHIQVRDAQVVPVPTNVDTRKPSPPQADALVSMIRSLTLDDDYFERRALRSTCIQKTPVDDFHPQYSEIIPGLFVADMYTATSPAVHRGLGVTHVVSVLKQDCPRFWQNLQHVCVPIEDSRSAGLLGHLDFITDWIQHALERGGQVMVHCVWGMSRSASVAIAFLMATRRMSLDDAFRHVVSRRKIVRPNSGFMQQLKVYERILRAREEKSKRVQRVFASMKIQEWR
ncbi:protein-tyrosine phosphatase-like protein [Fomitopsis serialis]|uniref:protein-tyrosine phosphatase-like protein n=1 Tax=Fomitopsis serialis TaxID=139415 RepID=UPI0020083865|nr:protein-tyrosine phosphatase-like protein [Neoantrodia serialis]KAH9924847.1 protein-tyrosine phosphatase-like protein [Neoantrodia serialis]